MLTIIEDHMSGPARSAQQALRERLAGAPMDTDAALPALDRRVGLPQEIGKREGVAPWHCLRISPLVLKLTTRQERASTWAAWWRGLSHGPDGVPRWSEGDVPFARWPLPLRRRGDVCRVLERRYTRPIERPLYLAPPLDLPPYPFLAASMTFTAILVVQTADGVTRMIHATETDQLDTI